MMELVYETGIIHEKDTDGRKSPKDWVMKRLNRSHLAEIMRLQQIIVGDLGRPDMLAAFSRDFMKNHLDRQGFVIGIFVENRLIAFRNVYYPSWDDREWNLGYDMGFDVEARCRVANLQMVCVHPGYRGNGLAFKMNRVALYLLRKLGRHQEVCATVSPFNVWNIPVLLNSGFHIRALKFKYGGKLRYVVHQNLRHPCAWFEQSALRVPCDDLQRIEVLLRAGYFGVAIDRVEGPAAGDDIGGYRISFKRLLGGAAGWPAATIIARESMLPPRQESATAACF